MRFSRLAFVYSVLCCPQDCRVTKALETLANLLEGACADERQATPILETIAFVLEQHIGVEGEGESECKVPARKLWNVVRKAHFRSTNIRKLEAAVKIYGALAAQGEMRKGAVTKLRDLLLHPYPVVSCCHESAVLCGNECQ